MHPIARWLLFLANFLLILLAVVQVSGRVFMHFLDDLEPRINALLRPQQIRVEGLRGGWSLLNPVVRVDRLILPAGEISGLVLQPDLIESALRSELVLRRALLPSGRIAFEKTDRGWWLAGMRRASESRFDVTGLLEHSDDIALDLDLEFRGAQTLALAASVRVANRGGRHRLFARVVNGQCATCAIRVEAGRLDAIPLLREQEYAVQVRVHDFAIGEPLLPRGEVRLGTVAADWRHERGEGFGRLSTAAVSFAWGGSVPVAADGTFDVWSRDRDIGMVGGLRLQSGQNRLPLDGLDVRYRDGVLTARGNALEVAPVMRFAEAVTAPVEKVGRWFAGLGGGGSLQDLWLRVAAPDSENEGWRLGYGARLRDGSVESFNGVPRVRHAGVRVVGDTRAVRFTLEEPSVHLAFPELFPRGWDLTQASGSVVLWFRPGYSAVFGTGLSATVFGQQAIGGFSIANSVESERRQLTLLIDASGATVEQALGFVPNNLGEGLLHWLQDAPRAGRVGPVTFAYQGQTRAAGVEHARRVELRADVEGAELAYHPDWPVLAGVGGALAVKGTDVFFTASAGQGESVSLAGSEVAVLDHGGEIRLSVMAEGDGAGLLDFVRHSPLREQAPFLRPEWVLAGPVRVSGSVWIPLRQTDEATPRKATADLNARLKGASLELPDLRLSFTNLQGEVAYATPHDVRAVGLTGKLFDEDVQVDIQPDGPRLWFRARGGVPYERALSIAGLPDPGFIEGALTYEASVGIGLEGSLPTEIQVSSDLAGTTLYLPGMLGREAADSTPTTVNLQLLSDYTTLTFQYRDVQGWMHLKERPLRGAIGLSVEPPMIDLAEDVVRIGGHLPEASLTAWTALFTSDGIRALSGGGEPFDNWRVDDVRIGKASVGDLVFADVLMDAAPEPGGVRFDFLADDVTGSVRVPDSAPIEVRLSRLRFAADERPAQTPVAGTAASGEAIQVPVSPPLQGPPEDADPLNESLVADIPEADVTLESVFLGDSDYGRWRFNLRKPSADVLAVNIIEAESRGMTIRTDEPMLWFAGEDMTSFHGELDMADLSTVLPQWNYEPSIASESATLKADVHWSGSPLNVSVAGMAGNLDFAASNGRLLEVQSGSGAMRIMSLFSFSAILKRLNFNFSDVIGKGVGFETLKASMVLDDGILTFAQPMEVRSTSSDFRLGGEVNLHTGKLDNELVVTLPVSKNLPWYGVYIALANPLAGLGVLVGERVLRKPLEQVSSAKYRVQGTLDEPDVRFVELFANKVSGKNAASAPPAEQTSAPAEAAADDGVMKDGPVAIPRG
ncbi:MAG: hypothetical protein H6994_06030 [Pseudomonadales bacterium]|nr:hypothetical protein [Pseudomonadales bacterium]